MPGFAVVLALELVAVGFVTAGAWLLIAAAVERGVYRAMSRLHREYVLQDAAPTTGQAAASPAAAPVAPAAVSPAAAAGVGHTAPATQEAPC